MKRRLLDLLVCPHDQQFPLELEITSAIDTNPAPDRCGYYCSNNLQYVEEEPVEKDYCHACSMLDVVEGRLHCRECQSTFEIDKGIPDLLNKRALEGRSKTESDKANEIEARDVQAHDYDRLAMLKLLSRIELPKVIKLLDLGENDLVVELGAGTGRVTGMIGELASEVVAVDFSRESLRASQRRCGSENVHWIQADINHLPLRDHVADHAFSCQVFEHLPGATARNLAVDEAARIIKGKGNFVISVYRDSWFWRLFGPKEGFHHGGIYYCRLTSGEFKEMLARRFIVDQMVPNVAMYLQIAKCNKYQPSPPIS